MSWSVRPTSARSDPRGSTAPPGGSGGLPCALGSAGFGEPAASVFGLQVPVGVRCRGVSRPRAATAEEELPCPAPRSVFGKPPPQTSRSWSDSGRSYRVATLVGAGGALVAAAAAYAGEIGRDQIMVNVLPGARDVHRFYARLGFAPLVVRRVTSIAALRRRLGAAELRPAPGLLRRRPGVRPLSSRAGVRPARRAANADSELSGLPVRSRLWSNPLAER